MDVVQQEFTCPVTRTKVMVSIPPKKDASEFCPECDFPMFWAYGVDAATKRAEEEAARTPDEPPVPPPPPVPEIPDVPDVPDYDDPTHPAEHSDPPSRSWLQRLGSTWWPTIIMAAILLVAVIVLLF